MARRSLKLTLPATAALRQRGFALRREASKPSCPNPKQASQIAEMLLEIAEMIETILVTHKTRASFAH